MFKLLGLYKWWAVGILAAIILAYVTYLNIRINYLKSDNVLLEAENKALQNSVKSLNESVTNQNNALEARRKDDEKRSTEAQEALKKARLGNAIRDDKIKAAIARLAAVNNQTCSSAIADIKKDLR